MFKLFSSMYVLSQSHWYHREASLQYSPCDCCGASLYPNIKKYLTRGELYWYNRGIFVWPTKIEPPELYGTSWNVTLGGQPLTVSIILEQYEGEGGDVDLPAKETSQLHTQCQGVPTQTIYCVYFGSVSEAHNAKPPYNYTFKEYYGYEREEYYSTFNKVLALLNDTAHVLFILMDEQLEQFNKCLDKYKAPVKIMKYPEKIVNRNYSMKKNPRLNLYFMTLDQNATAA